MYFPYVSVLRRAEIDVDVVSIEKNGHEPVVCSRKVRLVADKSIDEIKTKEYDCVVIPGGNDGAFKNEELLDCVDILSQ